MFIIEDAITTRGVIAMRIKVLFDKSTIAVVYTKRSMSVYTLTNLS